MTKWIAGLGLSAALAFAAPSTSEAQGPVVQGGLVNVNVGNISLLNNVNIAVALDLAANVCNVAVNVLAVQLGNGTATCTAVTGPGAGQQLTISPAR